MRHSEKFQPDYVLRVSEEVQSVACRSKPVVIINGKPCGRERIIAQLAYHS